GRRRRRRPHLPQPVQLALPLPRVRPRLRRGWGGAVTMVIQQHPPPPHRERPLYAAPVRADGGGATARVEAPNVMRPPIPNEAAERVLLGALLIQDGALVQVADWLTPSDFSRRAHGVIYAAMRRLHGSRRAVNLSAVRAQLGRRLV